jgi:SNF2 family DNA or RNA helicase
MIDLTKLKNKTTLEKIRNYSGDNDHILKMKKRLDSEGFFVLTSSQISYIEDNHERDTMEINRVVDITSYLGEQLKEKYELKNIPERVFVEKFLTENDKSYHVKGKLYKNQKQSILFHIPKTQLLTDMFYEPYEDLEVNFDSVNKINKKNRSLFKHQESAIKFLLKKNKSILSDDMGLGKTKSAIAAALLSGSEKILVICPANAKINWFREITEYIDEEMVTIVKSGFWQPKVFTIINYDILNRFHEIEDKRKK